MPRIALNYAVRVVTPHTGVVRDRDGRDRRDSAKRYFETRDEAVKFCGDERRVLYVPQDGVFRDFVADKNLTL